MPALATDIFAASRDSVKVNWSSPTVAARYPSARDGSVSPSEGFFDSAADAQAVINARGALIGVERRRFTVGVDDLIWPTVSTSLPQAQLVDTEQSVNGSFLFARMELDLEAETTSLELFG